MFGVVKKRARRKEIELLVKGKKTIRLFFLPGRNREGKFPARPDFESGGHCSLSKSCKATFVKHKKMPSKNANFDEIDSCEDLISRIPDLSRQSIDLAGNALEIAAQL